MANRNQNDSFYESMRPSWPLDDAIEWIKNNLSPEDVFSEKDLIQWAEENEYTKEGRSNG